MSVRSIDSKADTERQEAATSHDRKQGAERSQPQQWDRNCTSPIQTHRGHSNGTAAAEEGDKADGSGKRQPRKLEKDEEVEGDSSAACDREEGDAGSNEDTGGGEEEDDDDTPRSPQPVKLPPAVSPSRQSDSDATRNRQAAASASSDGKLPRIKDDGSMAHFRKSSNRMEFLSRLSGRTEEEEEDGPSGGGEKDTRSDTSSPVRRRPAEPRGRDRSISPSKSSLARSRSEALSEHGRHQKQALGSTKQGE